MHRDLVEFSDFGSLLHEVQVSQLQVPGPSRDLTFHPLRCRAKIEHQRTQKSPRQNDSKGTGHLQQVSAGVVFVNNPPNQGKVAVQNGHGTILGADA